eukprot:TRINITY_DN14402_c0_g1_i1.p1 TRINITY_DN14402_c0_g1~~TRINITY_DN14402_c0_g1_i1.p1  ORF type:complete len:494 (+),score=41.38 TRINITY_DN14402_c0_g1_i1:1619-3100(+)
MWCRLEEPKAFWAVLLPFYSIYATATLWALQFRDGAVAAKVVEDKMIIRAHSNIVSGLYVMVFELLVPLILGFALQKYISTCNHRALRNGKHSLRLTTTRISAFADYGITSRARARLTSSLGCFALVLTIVGSFAIDDRSRMSTTFVNAQLQSAITNTSNNIIDFTKHVSENGVRVSGTFLFSSSALVCHQVDSSEELFYSAVGSFDEDMESLSYLRTEVPTVNYSCAYARNGFVNGVQVREKYFDRIEFDLNCLPVSNITVRESSVWQVNASSSCSDVEILGFWCANFEKLVCVMQVGIDQRYVLIVVTRGVGNSASLRRRESSQNYMMHSRMLKSAAYLIATETFSGFTEAFALSRMSIMRNSLVEVEAGEVLETEVSSGLFLGTAGVATVITIIACLVSFLNWREHVVKNDLSGKNSLSGAMDVMLLAATFVGNGECVGTNEGVVVGVSGHEPRVGPLLGMKVGRTEFEEQHVRGRLRGRKNELEVDVQK